jgi:hypothetical protein
MRIVRTSEWSAAAAPQGYHVLTYAEEGFAPLNIHAAPYHLSKEDLVAFAQEVNRKQESGSLHPRVPLSAVPRTVIRDSRNAHALARHILEFLAANFEHIKATVLVCDFRTPSLGSHVLPAISTALRSPTASILRDIVVLE